MKDELSKIGKEQVALALILLKDWKTEGKFDVETTLYIRSLATTLGVEQDYDQLLSKIPPMRIEPR